jgi:acyl carrier protein
MSANTQAIKDAIRGYILREVIPDEAPDNLRDDTPLKEGILDSMSTLRLVSFVEESFHIEVEPHEASESFDRIEDIAALVQRKQK